MNVGQNSWVASTCVKKKGGELKKCGPVMGVGKAIALKDFLARPQIKGPATGGGVIF